MLYLFFLIFLSFSFIWIYAFFSANDFSLPSKSAVEISKEYQKVLVVFPHADDEVLSCGGLLSQLSKKSEVQWAILTKGERGTETAELDESLKSVRVAEAQRAAKLYGVTLIHQFDYPDNDVPSHREQVFQEMKKLIGQFQPELVITYDQSGLYGHPDHIVVSEVVTQIIEKDFKDTKLWYVSQPQKVVQHMKLPEHMADDLEFKSRRVVPNVKVWIGLEGMLKKTKALYTYQSQINFFKNGVPVKVLPLWFYTSISPYEYFYQTN